MTAELQIPSLRDLDSHFAFGQNWANYASLIDEDRVLEAERGLVRLLGTDGLRGRTFLDIGCGSGLHAVAAVRLGATRVVAVDIDPQSVGTASAVLKRFAPSAHAQVREESVFDLDPTTSGTFDIVYSWGVLHHTGAMRDALRAAARLVAPNGVFAFALYRRTLMCGFWSREKRWYAKASPRAQKLARAAFVTWMRLLLRRHFKSHVANYQSARGMDFDHDVHDWLGGYPYEFDRLRSGRGAHARDGFERVTSFTQPLSHGLLGSGCDEYVYRRAVA